MLQLKPVKVSTFVVSDTLFQPQQIFYFVARCIRPEFSRIWNCLISCSGVWKTDKNLWCLSFWDISSEWFNRNTWNWFWIPVLFWKNCLQFRNLLGKMRGSALKSSTLPVCLLFPSSSFSFFISTHDCIYVDRLYFNLL